MFNSLIFKINQYISSTFCFLNYLFLSLPLLISLFLPSSSVHPLLRKQEIGKKGKGNERKGRGKEEQGKNRRRRRGRKREIEIERERIFREKIEDMY